MALEQDKLGEAASHVVQNPFLVGLFGGIVALRGVPGDTWMARVFNVLCATLLAGFLSPALAEFFGLDTPAMQSACAFAVGLFGLNLVATIVAYINTMDIGSMLPWTKKGK